MILIIVCGPTDPDKLPTENTAGCLRFNSGNHAIMASTAPDGGDIRHNLFPPNAGRRLFRFSPLLKRKNLFHPAGRESRGFVYSSILFVPTQIPGAMSYLDLAPLRGGQVSELRGWSQGKNANRQINTAPNKKRKHFTAKAQRPNEGIVIFG